MAMNGDLPEFLARSGSPVAFGDSTRSRARRVVLWKWGIGRLRGA